MDQLLRHAIHLASQTEKSLISSVERRIAYVVSHGQSYASNGYAVRTQGVAEALNEHSFDMLCFVRPGRPWELGELQESFPPEKVVNGVRYIHSRWLTDDKVSNDLERLEASVRRFVELFLVYRPQVVLAASNWIVALPAWVAAKKLGLPFFYEVRGFWELSRLANCPEYSETREFYSEILAESFLYQISQSIFTLNGKMKEEIISRGVEASKVKIIPCAVNTLPKIYSNGKKRSEKEKLGIPAVNNIVAYIGSFNDYENVDELVDACRELIQRGKNNITLLLVGDQKQRWRAKEPWIIDVGRVNKDKVDLYYQVSDLIVIPRKVSKVAELVTPTKLIEALSFSKKVLVEESIPKKEYSSCRNLYKYSVESGEKLSDALLKSLGQGEALKEINIPIYRNYMGAISRELESSGSSSKSDFDIMLKAAKLSTDAYLNNVDELIEKIFGSVPKNEKLYTDASRIVKGVGLNQVENKILRHARNAFPKSVALANALFWASQRIGDFETCNAIISDLKKIYGKNPSQAQKKQIEKLSNTPAYQLSIIDYIGRVTPLDSPVKSKVAYVLHNTLPYSSGGYATRGDGLIQGMMNHGLEVTVVSRPGYPLDIKDDITEAEISLVESIHGAEYRRILSPQRRGLSALEYMKKASHALEAELRKVNPSVVMAASNHVTAIPAYLAAKRLGLPFVYEVRGFWEVTRMSREPEFVNSPAYKTQVLLEGMVAKRANQVFTLTQPMKEELIERGVEESKVELLPNSCNPERFTPCGRDKGLAKRLGIPEDVPVIGYIGTFVVYEGLEDLAHACSILKDKGYKFRLLLVGNENASGLDKGPITEEVISVAKAHGFEDWLIMPGRIPHEEVESYYSLIDVAPFPRKPWPVCEMVSPMKPLEALAMEKAVVVSSVRALVEMVQEDKTGLVFNKGSVESLAEQLARLIDDPELREKLGKSGRKWVEEQRTWNSTGKIAADIICEHFKPQ